VIAAAAAVAFPELPGLWSLSPLGALIGAIVLVYWLIVTGRLVPRSTHEAVLAVANKRGDEWKETAATQRTLIEQQSRQIGLFAEASRTPAEFFGTVMRAGGDSRARQAEAPEG
jgi:hypothetical protein